MCDLARPLSFCKSAAYNQIMRHFYFALVTLLLTALPVQALSVADSRHLLDRAGLGASATEVQRLLPLGRSAAIDRLLSADKQARTPVPAPLRELLPTQPERRRQALRENAQSLRLWWLNELLTTSAPVNEHLTLFWHNHFTSALRKVREPALLLRQNAVLRNHALGSFADLLRAMVRDAALLAYLDGVANRRQQPNENLARELLELFTLGEGHYGEKDIQAAARALSGWTLNAQKQAVFVPKRHDAGSKTFLGETGTWNSDDIVRILLAQPRTAEFVVEKLWRELISPQPDPVLVKRWAADWRGRQQWQIRPLLQTLLRSEAFWNPAQRGTLVKSPVELTVGTVRVLGIQPPPLTLLRTQTQLGQTLFDPPNVRGWPGGSRWIDSRTLPLRQDFVRRSLRFERTASAQPLHIWQAQLLALPPLHAPQQLGAILMDPVYQLK